MNIHATLNEVLVRLFRNINAIEESVIKQNEYQNITTNDMHVIEAIGMKEPKNMTAVARSLMVTTGTLTIAVNGLVKKGFVERSRSEEDRRVVLVSLTDKGRKAYVSHQRFHEDMVETITDELSEEEQIILEKALSRLNRFFREKQQSARQKDN
ncbi:MAG: MarR family transcriptional regulator [Lachnospiraceae bacterium]|nr:MarR family transcriptional regulator [Lachnospiraceae bacterium]MBQ9136278.1 MarR family transcriptional regulator [Lachnospiraceae bacterium]